MVTFECNVFVSDTVQKLSDETEKANTADRTAHAPTRQLVRSITVPLTQRLFLVKAGSTSHGPKPRTRLHEEKQIPHTSTISLSIGN